MVARARLHKFGGRTGRTASAAVTVTGGGHGHAWRVRDRDRARVALPASALAILRAIAKNAATTNGDWRPAVVTAVPTTHRQAVSSATTGGAAAGLAGSDVPDDTPVYLVTMTGHFTGDEAGDPTGPAAPAGRYLSLVVNARSFWVMGSGLSRKPPPVRPATLGPVTNIAW
jgi:hypothetical protein